MQEIHECSTRRYGYNDIMFDIGLGQNCPKTIPILCFQGKLFPVNLWLAFVRTSVPALFIAVSAAMAACQSEHVPLTVEWRGHSLQELRALADLPAVIQSGLGVGRPGLDGVAERGQPFNATDVVDEDLPLRRFLAAGREGDTWLVALERGGRGYSVEVFLYSALDATPKQRWVLLDRPKTLREVVQQMLQKEQDAD
jgi:hypothetical protein